MFLTIVKYLFVLVLIVYIIKSVNRNSITNIETFGPSQPRHDKDYSKIETQQTVKSKCGGSVDGVTSDCGSLSGKPLLPVMDPRFNMREICKESILLCGHLLDEEKQCEDCVTKHFLTIEALAEEAISLDKENQYSHHVRDLPKMCRSLLKGVKEKTVNCEDAAQQLRSIRKKFMPMCATVC